MRRRDFIMMLGATAWPVTARAQQPSRKRRIGVLMPWSREDYSRAFVMAFVRALAGFGWVEGENIQIDYRFAAADPALINTYAAELVSASPDVILSGTTPAIKALQQQTRTIPIVFALLVDPVGRGFVKTLAHPGGNMTGLSSYERSFIGKWLQLLKEAAPSVTRVAVIHNPETGIETQLLAREIGEASSFGVVATLATLHDKVEIEAAIAAQAREPGGGVVVLPEPFTTTQQDLIVAAANRYGLPSIGVTGFAEAGSLMSYYLDQTDLYARAASYIDRILKGANPGDLPVEQPSKFSLVINLKTAKALGLTIPPAVLAVADEVIE